MKRAPFVAVAAALALSLMGSAANAVTIDAIFNFVPTGTLTANTGDIDTATSVTTTGAPDIVTFILGNNIGLVGILPGPATTINLSSPTPLTLGATFTQTFTTADGTFNANLTVTSVTAGVSALAVLASGTITGPAGFDPTPLSYSASYTQNLGPGGQINASFNDSTALALPLPGALPLFATGLAGLGLLGWRRARKAQAV